MNAMEILKNFLGEEKFNRMMRQWESMTAEQRNMELNKVKSLTPEQQRQLLQNAGVNIDALQSQIKNTQPLQKLPGRFKF